MHLPYFRLWKFWRELLGGFPNWKPNHTSFKEKAEDNWVNLKTSFRVEVLGGRLFFNHIYFQQRECFETLQLINSDFFYFYFYLVFSSCLTNIFSFSSSLSKQGQQFSLPFYFFLNFAIKSRPFTKRKTTTTTNKLIVPHNYTFSYPKNRHAAERSAGKVCELPVELLGVKSKTTKTLIYC